ncbi:hypothetical protein TNCV_1218371 [Trichonephila clavipes]|nr:hypothetical protein TNCV_1218371 [Trichonephila clavipes]
MSEKSESGWSSSGQSGCSKEPKIRKRGKIIIEQEFRSEKCTSWLLDEWWWSSGWGFKAWDLASEMFSGEWSPHTHTAKRWSSYWLLKSEDTDSKWLTRGGGSESGVLRRNVPIFGSRKSNRRVFEAMTLL